MRARPWIARMAPTARLGRGLWHARGSCRCRPRRLAARRARRRRKAIWSARERASAQRKPVPRPPHRASARRAAQRLRRAGRRRRIRWIKQLFRSCRSARRRSRARPTRWRWRSWPLWRSRRRPRLAPLSRRAAGLSQAGIAPRSAAAPAEAVLWPPPVLAGLKPAPRAGRVFRRPSEAPFAKAKFRPRCLDFLACPAFYWTQARVGSCMT